MRILFVVLMMLGIGLTVNADLQPRPPITQPPPSDPYPPTNPYDPPSPYPPPGYNDVYGPGRTVRWEDVGVFRTEKFMELEVNIRVRDQFVNEVFVAGHDNEVDVTEALAYLSNGQVFRLNNMIGTVQPGRRYRVALDYRNSLRLERLVYRIRSGNLIGPRGSIAFQLGLAY